MTRSATAASARRVTLADVAKAANVSVSTASLAFSGRGAVASATRDRIVSTATLLGYSGPDPRARSLREGRSNVIGVILEDTVLAAFRDPVNIATVDGLSEVLSATGAGVLLLNDSPNGRDTLSGAAMDGAVLSGCSPRTDEIVGLLRQRQLPMVVAEHHRYPGVPCVDVDNVQTSSQLARYVRDLGHRRVAIAALPWNTETTRRVKPAELTEDDVNCTTDRLRGAWSVFPRAMAISGSTSSIEVGIALGRELFAADPRPTAVIAQSDLLALGVMKAAAELGLGVPDDVSVVGFDGIDLTGYTDLALTTIRQPMRGKGRIAAATLLRLIEGRRARSTVLPSEFVQGSTTAPPA